MFKGGIEVLAVLRLALEAAGDDDSVALVLVVVRLGAELVEVLRDGAEHVLAHALRTIERPGRRVAAARLDPGHLSVEPLQHSAWVAAVELAVCASNGLHILFRHASP